MCLFHSLARWKQVDIMLESIVLHQSGTGVRGGDGNVVGISWKTLTRSHPSPSLVVTCTHQVVVYKVGGSGMQWVSTPHSDVQVSYGVVWSSNHNTNKQIVLVVTRAVRDMFDCPCPPAPAPSLLLLPRLAAIRGAIPHACCCVASR